MISTLYQNNNTINNIYIFHWRFHINYCSFFHRSVIWQASSFFLVSVWSGCFCLIPTENGGAKCRWNGQANPRRWKASANGKMALERPSNWHHFAHLLQMATAVKRRGDDDVGCYRAHSAASTQCWKHTKNFLIKCHHQHFFSTNTWWHFYKG